MRASVATRALAAAIALAACHADPEPHVAPPTSAHGSSAIPVDVASAYGDAGAPSSAARTADAGPIPVATSSTGSDTGEVPAIARDEGIPADFTLHFERTACFGTCPQYRVDVDAKGKMTFSSRVYRAKLAGSGHPWVEACLDKKLGDAAVHELAAAVKRDGFFGMKDEYVGGPTDAPWANTKVTLEGRTRAVRHYGAAPVDPSVAKKLEDLEDTIDRVTGAAELVKTGKGLTPCKFAM